MKIYISEAFSAKLTSRSEDEVKEFNKKINTLKSLSKTDIIISEDVIELPSNKDLKLYAYNIQTSVYVVFAFKEKNEIVLLDEVKLVGKNEIQSLVYGSMRDEIEEQTDDNN